MISSETKWGASMERFGKKFDHALLSIKWAWRLRVCKQKPKPDYKSMTPQKWLTFNDVLREKLKQGNREICKDDVEEMGGHYEFLSECMRQTIDEVVPRQQRRNYDGRKMSQRTLHLYQERKSQISRLITKKSRGVTEDAGSLQSYI